MNKHSTRLSCSRSLGNYGKENIPWTAKELDGGFRKSLESGKRVLEPVRNVTNKAAPHSAKESCGNGGPWRK